MKPYYGPLALLLLLALTVLSMDPPLAAPTSAPESEFSAERAMTHVRDLARAPHPPGTPEHTHVRKELIKRFQALGLTVRTQKVRVVQKFSKEVRVVEAQNILARLPGQEKGPGLMLCAHYDSHPTGPGAGDDMAGVSVLLETARALALEKPRRDVLFLITDAEEYGLLGAEGFVDDAQELEDFPLVLNFEARGGSGPVFMFETGKDNAPLIEALAHTPRPLATSLMYALYKTLPNDTDLSVFKRAGKTGLNFAFAESWSHYHTALDTPERLDARSVQHQGDYALALARLLPGTVTENKGDAIYFDLFSRLLVRYPESLVWPLTALGLAAYLWAILSTRREEKFWRSWLIGIGLGPLALLNGAVVAVCFGFLIGPLRAGAPWRDPYGARWLEAALFLLSLAAALVPLGIALRKQSAKPPTLGALLWWVLLLLATTLWLPGASYLFLWPLLLATLGQLLRPHPVLAIAASVPTVVLLTPVWHGLALLLGFSLPPLLGGLVGLGLLPLLPVLEGLKPRGLYLLAGVGALCILVGWLGFRTSERYPRVVADSKEQSAPATPKATVVPGKLTLAPARSGFELSAFTKTKVSSAILDGKLLPLIDGKLALRFLAPPPTGFVLQIDAPLETTVTVGEDILKTDTSLPPNSIVAPGPFPGNRLQYRRSVTLPAQP
ncbi:MAG: M28 family peptidase [Armatimonas sp.]